jgi:hypothetical protein
VLSQLLENISGVPFTPFRADGAIDEPSLGGELAGLILRLAPVS